MMNPLRRASHWLFDRLGLEPVAKVLAEHKVPPDTAARTGWLYVFGSLTLTAFLVQVISGIALATQYVPTPESARDSLAQINTVPMGAFLRGAHFFGASAMVLFVSLHMARVFLTASYKFPREMNWISGVLLLVLVFGFAFTGQLLRFDSDGFWTVIVGSEFVSRIPLIGRRAAEFVLAGETVGGTTLSRFYALHILVLPLLLGLLVALHLWLVFFHGISELPRAGKPVDPATYREDYQRLEEAGHTYFPHGIWREAAAAFLLVGAIVALALVFGPKGPGLPPDPTDLRNNPFPDWFLLWYFALLFVKPRGTETFFMVYLPLLVFAVLVLLPLVFPKGERSPRRRPWAVAGVLLAALALGGLLVLGWRAPWVPAFETQPLGAQQLGTDDPAVLAGARVFHQRGCQFCHSVAGEGGRYGPALDGVALRLSPGEIAARTHNGVRDMPAYRDVLDPEEMGMILAFLRGLPR